MSDLGSHFGVPFESTGLGIFDRLNQKTLLNLHVFFVPDRLLAGPEYIHFWNVLMGQNYMFFDALKQKTLLNLHVFFGFSLFTLFFVYVC